MWLKALDRPRGELLYVSPRHVTKISPEPRGQQRGQVTTTGTVAGIGQVILARDVLHAGTGTPALPNRHQVVTRLIPAPQRSGAAPRSPMAEQEVQFHFVEGPATARLRPDAVTAVRAVTNKTGTRLTAIDREGAEMQLIELPPRLLGAREAARRAIHEATKTITSLAGHHPG